MEEYKVQEVNYTDTACKFVDKRWGYERWFANNKKEDYCGKELFIKEGCFTSMHYHKKKHEVFYILKGTLRLNTLDKESGTIYTGILETGTKFEVSRNVPHQLIADGGDVTLIEASTYHRDSDSYRVFKELSGDGSSR